MKYYRHRLFEIKSILNGRFEIEREERLKESVQHPRFDFIADFINTNYKLYVPSIKPTQTLTINEIEVILESLEDNQWIKVGEVLRLAVKEHRLNG